MAAARFKHDFDSCDLTTALEVPFGCAVLCNQFIEQQKPWAIAKQSPNDPKLTAILYHLADALRISAILISPAGFTPRPRDDSMSSV